MHRVPTLAFKILTFQNGMKVQNTTGILKEISLVRSKVVQVLVCTTCCHR